MALVGDLLMLPALLASPLGRFFGGHVTHATDSVTGQLQPDSHPRGHTDDSAVDGYSSVDGHSDIDGHSDVNGYSDVDVDEPGAGASARGQINDRERQQLSEGPHAALHAKLLKLRREQIP